MSNSKWWELRICPSEVKYIHLNDITWRIWFDMSQNNRETIWENLREQDKWQLGRYEDIYSPNYPYDREDE